MWIQEEAAVLSSMKVHSIAVRVAAYVEWYESEWEDFEVMASLLDAGSTLAETNEALGNIKGIALACRGDINRHIPLPEAVHRQFEPMWTLSLRELKFALDEFDAKKPSGWLWEGAKGGALGLAVSC